MNINRSTLGTATAVAATALLVASIAAAQHSHTSGTSAFDEAMQPILASYLEIQQELAADSTSGVQEAATSIADNAGKLDAGRVFGEHAEHYEGLPVKLQSAAANLSAATTLEAARDAFKQLSRPMALWGTMSLPEGIDVVYCPMAKGSWLQKQGGVRNPYHGKEMLTCGEIVGGASHAKKRMEHGHHG
jgi:Cu(I)/Ag(I) efflux system membrane fusion protein